MCLRVWTRAGWGVLPVECGWLVGSRAAGCLFVCERGAGVCGCPCGAVSCLVFCGRGVGVVCPLVSVWVASRERACLREVCGWVWDVEGVAFAQELFGF